MTGNDKILRNPGVVPLRTILRNFLNLVESCEAGSNDGSDSYETEFQELKQFSENLKCDSAYLCKEGEKSVNRKKNRYKDILPFDYTRVILGDYGDVPGSDYINANFIKGASGSSAYIACQGPLPHTVNDFWRMVVECEVQVIVMACNEQESGKHKCENYWVEEEGVERQFGQVTIWLKKCRQVCPDFLVRTMRIRYTTSKGETGVENTKERNVCQFHYSAWPDHGVPTKVRPLLDMVRLIRDCQTSETLPVLVHCSAGCGRTGTICAIDYVWGLLRLGKLTAEFSLFHLVREMRRQRIAMVQTKDQYVLVHRAVKELFEEQLKIIDSHPYANVDEYGLPLDINIKAELDEPMYETVEYHSPIDLVPYQPSTSIPPIPRMNGDLAVNSKLEKEVDNHCRHQEQGRSAREPVPSVSKVYQRVDDITVLSSDGEEKMETEKERESEKATPSPPKSNIRNALLRKPSIVKLKAFFEKSKDGKKSGSTNLSRAKSDVSSSKFYSFNNLASSFHSRGNNLGAKQSSSHSTDLTPTESKGSSKDKSNISSKPALHAKPMLPVKRSKSLKLGKDETTDQFLPSHKTTDEVDSPRSAMLWNGDVNSQINSPTSFSTSITNITNNPIRVSIKQVEIPELQKPVSKSVRPEIQTAMTHELLKQSNPGVGAPISHLDSTSTPKKPMVPPKSQIVIGSSIYAKIGVGVAKEMEDAMGIDRRKAKYENIKKYDTVTANSLASVNKRTSLTRSQSHVWQPTKVQLPVRIFSDENIHQTSDMPERFIQDNPRQSPHTSSTQSSGGSRNGSFDRGTNDIVKLNPPNQTNGGGGIDQFSEEPVVRRRAPKTFPQTYVPSGDNHKSQTNHFSPSQESDISKSTNGTRKIGESRGKELPPLRTGCSRSRENSSESSSNTATPRSSLPGTPTLTIDPTYSQLMRSNLQGLGNSRSFSKQGNGITPPKSILKGSLSSTPSESDERLDTRQVSSDPSLLKPGVITAPQKINTVRIAVGVRERRNSFRQAVWKEDQPTDGTTEVQDSPTNPYLFSNGQQQQPPVPDQVPPPPPPSGFPSRSHRDYEPIWPDATRSTGKHFRTESSQQFYSNSDDYYLRPPSPKLPMPQSSKLHSKNFNGAPKQLHTFSTGHSQQEERSILEQNCQPGFQNRLEEIKLLLEELKAPTSAANAIIGPDHRTGSSSKGIQENSPPRGKSGTPVGLKHQRSLRTPSRPQYPQGLSCFTFRKPSSLESITDPSHYEVKTIVNGETFPNSSYTQANGRHENVEHESSTNYLPREQRRNSNDYVSLRQTHTSYAHQHDKGGMENATNPTNLSEVVPIAPPRTKRFQQNSKRNASQTNPTGNDKVPNSSSISIPSNWTGNDDHTQRNNLPEIVRCTDHTEERRMSEDHCQNNVHPTSPKNIIKALGIFQAKAANMRSRFANWTETKERSNAERNNSDSLLTAENDPKDEADGGFMPTSSVPEYQPRPSRSKSKHQYL